MFSIYSLQPFYSYSTFKICLCFLFYLLMKYKIEIIVMTQVIATYEFDNLQEARLCYYKNDSILDQYTKLYVDGVEIRPIPQITKILGSAPKYMWCGDKYKY